MRGLTTLAIAGAALAACGDEADDYDVLVTIQDPLGIAVAATDLFVGERLEALEARPLKDLTFNVTIPVKNGGTRNPRMFWAEARDDAGTPLARGAVEIDFDGEERVELDLRAICDAAQRCPAPVATSVCCVGPNLCVPDLAACPPDSTPKTPGFALSFEPGQRAIAPGFNVTPSGAGDDGLTIEAWVRPESCAPSCQGSLVAKGGYWTLKLEEDGPGLTLEARVSAQTRVNPSGGTIAFDRWQHVAVTYDGEMVQLYAGGERVGGSPLAGPLDRGTDLVRFGSLELTMALDEVRVWSYARPQPSIQSTKDHRLTGDEEGLVAYWSFDEGEGQVAVDLTQNGNDAVLGDTSEPDAADPIWVARDL